MNNVDVGITWMLIAVTAMSTLSHLCPPHWASSLSWKWIAAQWSTVIGGVLAGGCAALVVELNGLAPITAVIAPPAAGVLGSIVGQSLWTDILHKTVDRWLLRIGIVLTVVPGFAALISVGTSEQLLLYLVVILAMVALMFFSSQKIGASDVRALVVSVTAVYPVSGLGGLTAGAWIYVGCVLIIGIIQYARKRTWRIMLPAVPIITGSFLAGMFYVLMTA